jgi:histidinol-phosphate aminotransferase
MRAFCEPREDAILFCPPTYGMYFTSAETLDVEARAVPLTPEWQLDLPAIQKQLKGVKLIYVCSPNNPTGNVLNHDDLRRLLTLASDAIVVVDEAYVDFCRSESVVEWLKEFPNLAILRTLSKAFALAGLRCGFTLASEAIIAALNKVIAPYPIPVPVADIAAQALSKQGIERVNQNIADTLANRATLMKELKQCECVEKVYDTQTNYVLVRFKNGADVFKKLNEKHIILRDQSKQTGLQDCVRITVGTFEECEKLIDALKSF